MTYLLCCTPDMHLDKLLARSIVTPAGCWDSLGYHDKDGYAQLRHNGVSWRAHRFAWVGTIGPIADEYVIDHLCRNTGCLNPEHLEPVSVRTNTLRGLAVSTFNAHKTHCPRGHRDWEVIKTGPAAGERFCVTCARELKRVRRERFASTGLREGDARHGTDRGYTDYKCRCDLCRAFKVQSRVAYR